MNVIQDQINLKIPIRTIKCSGTEKLIMIPPSKPLQFKTRTPVTGPAALRALTSASRSVSSNTRSASSRPVDEHRFILALCEGRGQARGIVGIAAIDIDQSTLIMCQIADVQNYANTMTKINILRPTTIIVPSTFIECVPENRLLTAVRERSRTVAITSVPRIDFNSNRGLNQVRLLCASAYESALLSLKHKFYAAAAAAALLRYIERAQHIVYCSHSIRVELQEPEDLTIIDIDTADRLELVMSRASSDTNLLSVLDHCVTPGGKRLLRATILQPPCKQQIVESRLDCVSEILEDKEFFSRLRAALMALADIEQSVTLGRVMSHTVATAGVTERQLNYVLSLRSSLVAADTLHDVLASAKHPVLRSIYSQLAEAPQEILLKLIGKIINDDAHPARGHSGDMQRCFAIRAGFNDLLDVARKTYTEIIDDMRSYIDRLAEQFSLPLRLAYNSKRGFHITMKSHSHTNLPAQFVQVDRGRTNLTMTTSDLVNYGLQLRTVSQEIMTLSKSLMHELLSDIRPHVGQLYQLCDNVAFLDTLQSLAVASAVPGLVRPRFNAFMRLEAARHPLLERTCPDGAVANTALAQPKRNFHIITGPNMSGKSIYVRQLVLIQIMAQVGCFIPAESVTLRLCDRVYAIVGREDCIESGASSFVKEMREVRYLFDTLTDNSLVVIDELCRATSCDEGTSIARAICEKLLCTRAFIFIATHYLSLATLANEYANTSNWHMETLERKIISSSHVRLIFTHRLLRGVTPVRQYGVKLARLCGSTNFVAERAAQLLNAFMPSTYDDCPNRSCNQQADFLRHELEADLELLELENELTPELRLKMITSFEEKTGQLYQPPGSVLMSPEYTSSITSKKIQHVILQQDSTISLKAETDKVRTSATSNSCSEMDVNTSYLQSSDPLGNILKCPNRLNDGSSEWTLPNRNTESKESSNSQQLSPFDEDSSLPMRIVATTYSFDEDSTFQDDKSPIESQAAISVLSGSKPNFELNMNQHKTSTSLVTPFELCRSTDTRYLNKNTLSDFGSDFTISSSQHNCKMNNSEKSSCAAVDINNSISKPKLDTEKSSLVSKNIYKLNSNHEESYAISNISSLLNVPETESKNYTANYSVHVDLNKSVQISGNNSKYGESVKSSLNFYHNRTRNINFNKLCNIFSYTNDKEMEDSNENYLGHISKETKPYKYGTAINRSSTSTLLNTARTESDISKESSKKNVSNKDIPQKTDITSDVKFTSSMSPKGLTFDGNISSLDVADYGAFLTNINKVKSKSNVDSFTKVVYKTSTPISSPSSADDYDLAQNLTSPRVQNNSDDSYKFLNIANYASDSTRMEISSSVSLKSDTEEKNSFIRHLNNININDNISPLSKNVSRECPMEDISSLLNESLNFGKVSKLTRFESACEKLPANTNVIKNKFKRTAKFSGENSDTAPDSDNDKIIGNKINSLNSTTKLSFGVDDYINNDSKMKLNLETKTSSLKSQQNSSELNSTISNRKIKRKRKEQKENEYGVKKAKLLRLSSMHQTDVEKIAVARRGKDGHFKVKISSSDLDEIVKKYLPTADNTSE